MKALISPMTVDADGRQLVAQVAAEDFAIAEPLYWVDCGDSIKPGDWYDGITFRAPAAQAQDVVVVAKVQELLDSLARSWGYDNAKSAVTYADEPAVARFQAEGQAIRAWRSLVWARLYEVQAEVVAGTRATPTLPELLALLPAAPERPTGT